MIEKLDTKDAESMKRLRSLFGPQQVDKQIRLAIQFCWMSLPPKRQNVGEVEKQIRRMMERALRDLRKDSKSFGFGE
jgi:hypothetical protein